jgi:DNA modification methylase
MNTITMHVGDVRDVMAGMAGSSVDLIVTSPPFLALRSYLPADHVDKHREIGGEPTPAQFLDTLLELTAEWRRLLTPTGSICVELGDTYSGSNETGWHRDGSGPVLIHETGIAPTIAKGPGWPLAKSLCGIPTLYTWSLAYGRNLLNPAHTFPPWRIRNLLVWTRPNPPVGALGDKFRPATSYVTVACTSDRRWFDLDAVRTEPISDHRAGEKTGGVSALDGSTRMGPRTVERVLHPAGAPPLDWWDDTEPGVTYVTVACTSDRRWFDLDAVRSEFQHPDANDHNGRRGGPTYGLKGPNTDRGDLGAGNFHSTHAGAPPLDWWEHDWQPLHNMPTAPYPGAHYATYPVTLPRRLIEAMCPREVCTVCGEARRRLTSVTFEPHGERREENKGVRGFGVVNGEHAQHMAHGRATKNVDTLGWSDCGHYDPVRGTLYHPYRPGVVLDPFAGSGTTGLAAALCGRDAILIDLDPRNVSLARHRIGDHVAILNESADGHVTTWTVEPNLPGLKGEAEGQLSLFGGVA